MKSGSRKRHPLIHALGAELKLRRHQRKWSQEKLALQAGLSTTVVRRIEKGLQNFEIKTLLAIAEQLRAPLSELFAAAEHRS